METGIQYTTTSDGVRIAYTTLGEGPPLLMVEGLAGAGLDMRMTGPVSSGVYDRLGPGRQLILYDPRNCGLSTAVDRLLLEDFTLDIEAVRVALNLALPHHPFHGTSKGTRR